MNYLKAIISGVVLWVMIFILFTLINITPNLKESVIAQNVLLFASLIGFVWFALRLYYRKGTSKTNGFALAAIMVVTGLILDGAITVPFVIIPEGGSYHTFFTNPNLWFIIIEIFIVNILYCKLSVKSHEEK
jgi:hypothetical protein